MASGAAFSSTNCLRSVMAVEATGLALTRLVRLSNIPTTGTFSAIPRPTLTLWCSGRFLNLPPTYVSSTSTGPLKSPPCTSMALRIRWARCHAARCVMPRSLLSFRLLTPLRFVFRMYAAIAHFPSGRFDPSMTVLVLTLKSLRQSLHLNGMGLRLGRGATATLPHLGHAMPLGHLSSMNMRSTASSSSNILLASMRPIPLR